MHMFIYYIYNIYENIYIPNFIENEILCTCLANCLPIAIILKMEYRLSTKSQEKNKIKQNKTKIEILASDSCLRISVTFENNLFDKLF